MIGVEVISDPQIYTGFAVRSQHCIPKVEEQEPRLCRDITLDDPSRLSSPKISHTAHFRVNAVWGGLSERLAFHSSEISALLDISINPWNE